MIENDTVPLSARVTKVASNGRKRYDPQAKRALIQACLQPGVSVAAMALRNGINANLLRKWITAHQGGKSVEQRGQANANFVELPIAMPIAMSVVTSPAPAMTPRTLAKNVRAHLPNGVQLELGTLSGTDLSELLSLLSALPCSASTRS